MTPKCVGIVSVLLPICYHIGWVMPSGFIRVREMSGKSKCFQGQGLVREFYVVSGKNEFFSKMSGKCQGIYKFQFVSNDENRK